MRLFTAIDLPHEITDSLERLLGHLRPLAQLKWSPVYNFHVTTKFIGEWPEARLDELKSALRQTSVSGDFAIQVSGLGWFPNPHSPRVFWAGIHGDSRLTELARAIDESTFKLGVPKEERPYSPHLTLARIKDSVSLQEMQRAIAQLESVDFGEFTAREFHLYVSEPGAAHTVYKKIADFPLHPLSRQTS